jgi:glycerol-3-phosphate acyltransferase PlsY
MVLELTLSGLLLIAAYLLGSFPTGYLAAWLLKGIDIREQGSGSTGATNVLRTLGKGPALVVLLIDALKGVGAIALVNGFYALTETPRDSHYLATLVSGFSRLCRRTRTQ